MAYSKGLAFRLLTVTSRKYVCTHLSSFYCVRRNLRPPPTAHPQFCARLLFIAWFCLRFISFYVCFCFVWDHAPVVLRAYSWCLQDQHPSHYSVSQPSLASCTPSGNHIVKVGSSSPPHTQSQATVHSYRCRSVLGQTEHTHSSALLSVSQWLLGIAECGWAVSRNILSHPFLGRPVCMLLWELSWDFEIAGWDLRGSDKVFLYCGWSSLIVQPTPAHACRPCPSAQCPGPHYLGQLSHLASPMI